MPLRSINLSISTCLPTNKLPSALALVALTSGMGSSKQSFNPKVMSEKKFKRQTGESLNMHIVLKMKVEMMIILIVMMANMIIYEL